MDTTIQTSAQAHKTTLNQQKQEIIKILRCLSKWEKVNRFVCYLCLIPSFYALSLVGENRPMPTTLKIGTGGLVVTMVTAGVLRHKEDHLLRKIHRITRDLRQLSR